MALAPEVPVRTSVTQYALEDANEALDDLRGGRVRGAAVLSLGEAAAGEEG
jgi:propanol-preferring alcohol dehydrogenase